LWAKTRHIHQLRGLVGSAAAADAAGKTPWTLVSGLRFKAIATGGGCENICS